MPAPFSYGGDCQQTTDCMSEHTANYNHSRVCQNYCHGPVHPMMKEQWGVSYWVTWNLLVFDVGFHHRQDRVPVICIR